MQNSNHPTTVYIGVPDMVRIVQRKGLSACIAGVAERIERDFLRWNEFDKIGARRLPFGRRRDRADADRRRRAVRLQVRQRPPEATRATACPR